MKPELLRWIVCPECSSEFHVEGAGAQASEIRSGDLVCESGHRYGIRDGIPLLLHPEEIEDNYSRNFQYYWRNMNWRRDGLSRRRFHEISEYKAEDLKGKLVLDAGCGGGRWTTIIADMGATVVGLDYTRAIDIAQENTKDQPNVFLMQGDIFRLPFRPETFDIVHCHGVLMATPDTKKGAANLARVVKPGGDMHLLLYHRISRIQQAIDNAICGVTKRVPTKLAFQLATLPTALEYIPGATWLLGNVIHLSGQPDWTLKHLHNFDWYTCEYRWRQSPEEVLGWYREWGFTDAWITNSNNFRKESQYAAMKRFREWALEHDLFLKATLGVRGVKGIAGAQMSKKTNGTSRPNA